MRRLMVGLVAVVSLSTLLVCVAGVQTLNIWPGVAPGSENWKQKERVALPSCFPY